MLPDHGIPPISRNIKRRGGTRGNHGSDAEARRGRKVHFDTQQPADGTMARGAGRGRGSAAPQGPAVSTRQYTSTKAPNNRGGFAQQIVNHIQGQSTGRRKMTSTGEPASYEDKFNMVS